MHACRALHVWWGCACVCGGRILVLTAPSWTKLSNLASTLLCRLPPASLTHHACQTALRGRAGAFRLGRGPSAAPRSSHLPPQMSFMALAKSRASLLELSIETRCRALWARPRSPKSSVAEPLAGFVGLSPPRRGGGPTQPTRALGRATAG